MKKVCCPNGHYFDADKFCACPVCHPPTGAESSHILNTNPPETQLAGADTNDSTRQKKTCPSGHIYDGNRFPSCPICDSVPNLQPPPKPLASNMQPTDPTKPQEPEPSSSDRLAEQDNTYSDEKGEQKATSKAHISPSASQNVTHPDSDSLPVGWLIGYTGVYRGTLFSCHTGRNSIGKSSTSYIDLSCDSSIEDDIQALVIYDPHERQFFLQAGTGKGLVYHNDSLVFSHDLLEAYDHIQIGNTDLVFIPLCGPHFSWEEV